MQIVERPKPLPLPGQLKPLPGNEKAPPEPADPHARVDQANGAARIQPIRQGASQSFSQVGEQVVGRSLNIRPTITIRPDFPVRVLVTHDLVLEPYRG